MTRQRHAIPTGLAVEDRFLTYGAYSLSMRQFLILVAGVALAYGLWKDHPEDMRPSSVSAFAAHLGKDIFLFSPADAADKLSHDESRTLLARALTRTKD